MKIQIKHNFLTQTECQQCIGYANDNPPWRPTNDSWNERVVDVVSIHDYRIKPLLIQIQQRVHREIVARFGEPAYIETYQIVRWPPGSKLDPPHADSENPNGSPHPFPWRHYSVVIYLTNDFTGGEIFFPDYGLTPKIEPGMMVSFLGTCECMHGVKEVLTGTRYTLVMFLTRDLQHKNYD